MKGWAGIASQLTGVTLQSAFNSAPTPLYTENNVSNTSPLAHTSTLALRHWCSGLVDSWLVGSINRTTHRTVLWMCLVPDYLRSWFIKIHYWVYFLNLYLLQQQSYKHRCKSCKLHIYLGFEEHKTQLRAQEQKLKKAKSF